MSFISAPNLREIETWEGYLCNLNVFVILCKGEEENVKKIFMNKYLKNC